ncbi:MAG TPA: DUF4835 family protein [Cytophagaceae bacterium]|jgi:hypothetical protein
MKIKNLSFIIVFIGIFLSITPSFAQGELQCTITLDYESLEVSADDKTLLTELKNVLTDFVNTRKWTTDNFGPEERIKCNILIRFTSIPPQGQGVYQAKAFIQSSRPVYGGGYETILMNFLDENFNFTYTRGLTLDFNENIYLNELTSLIGFYANVILGFDYDSFSKLGGTPFFEKARTVATTAPADGGWKPLSDPHNRAGLVDNLTSQQMVPLREELYNYHRKVLDDYLKDPAGNYAKVLDLLKAVKVFNDIKRPNATVVRNFFTAKNAEFVGMFSEAPGDVKIKAMAYFTELDPTNSQKYQKIFAQ